MDPDTLANLGPLRALAAVWTSDKGVDVNPKADGLDEQAYVDLHRTATDRPAD